MAQRPRHQRPHQAAGPDGARDDPEGSRSSARATRLLRAGPADATAPRLRPRARSSCCRSTCSSTASRSATWCAGSCPPGDGTPEDDYPLLVQHAVSGYVRGQLLFSLVMGARAASACEISAPSGSSRRAGLRGLLRRLLWRDGVHPVHRADPRPVPAVLVALFRTRSGPCGCDPVRRAPAARGPRRRAAGVRHLAADQPDPHDLRAADRLHVYGIVGALIALPVIAVMRETVVYLRATSCSSRGDAGRRAGAALGTDPDRCAECGAPASAGDSYCRACGASLEPRVRVTRAA